MTTSETVGNDFCISLRVGCALVGIGSSEKASKPGTVGSDVRVRGLDSGVPRTSSIGAAALAVGLSEPFFKLAYRAVYAISRQIRSAKPPARPASVPATTAMKRVRLPFKGGRAW